MVVSSEVFYWKVICLSASEPLKYKVDGIYDGLLYRLAVLGSLPGDATPAASLRRLMIKKSMGPSQDASVVSVKLIPQKYQSWIPDAHNLVLKIQYLLSCFETR